MKINNGFDKIQKPFLRWAGGKQQIVGRLMELLPQRIERCRYIEPFLGAGSLFFALRPKRAILSDANHYLIDTYLQIKKNPRLVAAYLQKHKKYNNKDYYYKIRQQYNNCSSSSAQTARFIYLNKTSYNGIFRVNQKNEYNVPYGNKSTPAIPKLSELTIVSNTLSKAKIRCSSYEEILNYAKKGDFVYFDPPYPPLNGTAYFTHYTKERFNEKDQKELSEVYSRLDKIGCLIMMSNADTLSIRRLYKKFRIYELDVVRYLTCKSKRYVVKELVIVNY